MLDCPDCGVAPGRWHRPGCRWETCPYCGEHWGDCGCAAPPLDDRIPWAGCCPWLEACLRYGLFERRVQGRWVACGPGEPGAEPDVARLLRECAWCRPDKRFRHRRRAPR